VGREHQGATGGVVSAGCPARTSELFTHRASGSFLGFPSSQGVPGRWVFPGGDRPPGRALMAQTRRRHPSCRHGAAEATPSSPVRASAVGSAFHATRLVMSRAHHWFSKIAPPSAPHLASTPTRFRALRRAATQRPARSVLAVPPGLDGFLRQLIRRLVASCSRPWGSPRFPHPVLHACSRLVRPRVCMPSRAFPSREVVLTSP
jgi:hypothetical protein